MPVYTFYQYLVKNYSHHCPPDDVSSGVGGLPLDFVWINGTENRLRPTSKRLPITNALLNGKELYKLIMPRYTTTDLTPDRVYEEGIEQLNKLYPEVRWKGTMKPFTDAKMLNTSLTSVFRDVSV